MPGAPPTRTVIERPESVSSNASRSSRKGGSRPTSVVPLGSAAGNGVGVGRMLRLPRRRPKISDPFGRISGVR